MSVWITPPAAAAQSPLDLAPALTDPSAMSPLRRKITFAVAFESLGIALSAAFLLRISDATSSQSLTLSAIGASVALGWNFIFNLIFERWEEAQPVRGRPLALRTAHALLFEGGLTLLMVPVMAWWLDVGLLAALGYEAALIALFMAYTYAFTWAFDHIFGLPKSAL